jgi:hypothetical protein
MACGDPPYLLVGRSVQEVRAVEERDDRRRVEKG